MSDLLPDEGKLKYKKVQNFIVLAFFTIAALIFIFFNNYELLNFEPEITPVEWCEKQPCSEIDILSLDFTIVQPSSTFLVYLLGIITVILGLLLRKSNSPNTHRWWGFALIAWGLGALSAGTSYQAFSYEIKCAGRDLCLWTSWWEVFYMILTVASVNVMMVAFTSSFIQEEFRNRYLKFAFVSMIGYVVISVLGSLIPIKFLISFELMVLFLLPNFLIFFVINLRRNLQQSNPVEKRFIIIWVSLGFILVVYFMYLVSGLTEILWESHIWFSENDILHIGLILWMIYLFRTVSNYVKDVQT